MHFASGYGLLFDQAIADQLGLIPTDLRCQDAVRGEPRQTAALIADFLDELNAAHARLVRQRAATAR
jgi:hypothetical protein